MQVKFEAKAILLNQLLLITVNIHDPVMEYIYAYLFETQPLLTLDVI